MKYLILLLFVFSKGYSQYTPLPATPYIEVSGTAAMSVVPDVYTIRLRLMDKLFNSAGSQENKLRNELLKAGLVPERLSLLRISTDYIRTNGQVTGRTQVRDYSIEVNTTKQLIKLFTVLEKQEVELAFITEANFLKRDSVQMVLAQQALYQARNKASGLLSANGYATGDPIEIIEEKTPWTQLLEIQQRNTAYGPDTLPTAPFPLPYGRNADQAGYDKIHFEVSYRVKYAIKTR